METHPVFTDWKTILLKYLYYAKWPTESMQSLTDFFSNLFEIEKSILKLIWYFKGLQITKASIKKNNVGGLILPSPKH